MEVGGWASTPARRQAPAVPHHDGCGLHAGHAAVSVTGTSTQLGPPEQNFDKNKTQNQHTNKHTESRGNDKQTTNLKAMISATRATPVSTPTIARHTLSVPFMLRFGPAVKSTSSSSAGKKLASKGGGLIVSGMNESGISRDTAVAVVSSSQRQDKKNIKRTPIHARTNLTTRMPPGRDRREGCGRPSCWTTNRIRVAQPGAHRPVHCPASVGGTRN